MSGCFYDARGLCRNSPDDKVDYRCLKIKGRCYNITDPVKPADGPEPTKSTSPSPSTSPSTSTSTGPSLSVPAAATVVDKDMHYLSGPVSFSSFMFQGRTFNFLGDAHYSTDGTCDELYPSVCTTKNTADGSCYDLLDLLKNKFTQAKKDGKYIDFYLELPFRSRVGGDDMTELATKLQAIKLGLIRHGGYLTDINTIFSTCFIPDKLGCSYAPNVRFHYADIRQLKSKSTNMISLATYMCTARIKQLFNYLIPLVEARKMVRFVDIPDDINAYIELTNALMEALYNRGQTLSGTKVDITRDIFMSHFDSDDFPGEIEKILDKLIKPHMKYLRPGDDIVEITDILKGFYSTRGGKKVHKVRAQLLALEADGLGGLANSIQHFIVDKYNSVDQTKIYAQWSKFYSIFQNLKKLQVSDKHLLEALDFLKTRVEYMETMSTLIETDALLMDAYTLPRMFRKYTGPKATASQHSNQVIVYAGDAHISVYEEFFHKVLNATNQFKQRNIDDRARGKIKRCIKGKNLQNYF